MDGALELAVVKTTIGELLTIVVVVRSSLSHIGFSRQGDLTTHLRAHERN